MKLFRTALLLALLPLLSACAGSPESLAKDLQAAFEKGDMDAVLALTQLDGTPSDLRFFLMDQVIDCGAADTACAASAAPLDDDFKKSLAGLAEQGLEAAVMPEGLIVLQIKQKDGQGSGKAQMPYAKVDGKYRLVAQRYTAAKLAEMRATTNQQIFDKMLAAGIYDSAAGERRTDWKDTATELPADGGEPGQVLVRTSTALHAAVLANDPDAAVKSGDGFAKMVLGDKDYDGKPVELELRKAKLRAQSMRFLHEVKVSGGWIRGEEAVLLVDAKDGIGWISRGALFMSKNEGQWGISGKQLISYPQ